jgi:hypothetical protein
MHVSLCLTTNEKHGICCDSASKVAVCSSSSCQCWYYPRGSADSVKGVGAGGEAGFGDRGEPDLEPGLEPGAEPDIEPERDDEEEAGAVLCRMHNHNSVLESVCATFDVAISSVCASPQSTHVPMRWSGSSLPYARSLFMPTTAMAAVSATAASEPAGRCVPDESMARCMTWAKDTTSGAHGTAPNGLTYANVAALVARHTYTTAHSAQL